MKIFLYIRRRKIFCYIRKCFCVILKAILFKEKYIAIAMSNITNPFIFDLDVKAATQRKIYVEKFSRNSTHFIFFPLLPEEGVTCFLEKQFILYEFFLDFLKDHNA